MGSRLLWRRSGAAAGLYLAVALGLVGTIVAANELGVRRFGVYAFALATASFFQMLLDLTVEECLTKYGFRYVEREDFGRLRRLFQVAVRLKLMGGLGAAAVIAALAPVAEAVVDDGLWLPILVAAVLPLVQSVENVAGTALLLHGRYDLRGWYSALAQGLRFSGVVVGVQFGAWQAILGIVAAQALATLLVSGAGLAALRRFPAAVAVPLGDDRSEIRSFVIASTIGTGVVSLRTTLPPLVLGPVAGTDPVGLLKIAQAPQTGLGAASSPVRLVLLTEQTRAWEQGRESEVYRGVRRYMLAAAALMAVAVPVFYALMPWLVRTVFKDDYQGAITAARIVLFAGALQVVLGWTKSFPTTIGRPRLRILAHTVEAAVLLPLVAVLGDRHGVTGAAVAILVATCAFAGVWALLLVRLRDQRRAARQARTAAGA